MKTCYIQKVLEDSIFADHVFTYTVDTTHECFNEFDVIARALMNKYLLYVEIFSLWKGNTQSYETKHISEYLSFHLLSLLMDQDVELLFIECKYISICI